MWLVYATVWSCVHHNTIFFRYVFLEYSSEAEAVAAVKTADGYKLDKGHVFTVNLLTDFEQ